MATTELFQHTTQVESFPAGHVIFRTGDPGTLTYVVREGEVDIVIDDQVFETVGPGGIFGEMALIDAEPRSATVLARTDCTVVPIDEQRFTFLVQQTPYFSLQLMRVLVARLRRMNTRSSPE
jgi:CRP/FNR family cyclic AMP-dependent transcriptional regulator